MSKTNVGKNLTDEGRKKGREKAIRRRVEARNGRRAQVKIMRQQGKSKAEISRFFGVSWETINRDCKELESQSKRAFGVSIVDAIFAVIRREIAGKISTLEAREEVEQLIDLAAGIDAKEGTDEVE